MLRQWSDVETATKKAYESEGTAAKENEKYMNSMQGKIAATQAAWQALSNSFLSSDFLKGLIDGGQTFLSVMNNIVKTTGALPPILAVIAGYLSAKNIGFFTTISQDLTSAITGASTLSNKMGILGNSFKDISMAWQAYGKAGLKNIFANTSDKLVTSMDKEMLENFFTQIKNGVPKVEALENTMFGASKGARDLALSVDTSEEGLKNFRTTLDGVQVAEKGYTTTTIGAKVATVAFQTALTFGLALAIQLIITLFQKLNDAIPTVENTTNWLKDSATKIKEFGSKIDEVNEKLTTTKSRITELKNMGSSISLVEKNELERLIRVNNELERQKRILQSSLNQKNKENIQNFGNAISTKANEDWSRQIEWWDVLLGGVPKGLVGLYEGFTNQAGTAQDKFNRAIESFSDAKKVFESASDETIEKYGGVLQASMNKDKETIIEYADIIKGYMDELGDYDYSSLPKDAKNAVDYAEYVQNVRLMVEDSVGNQSLVFANIYNQGAFAEAHDAIEKLRESNNLTSESLETLYSSNNVVGKSFVAMIDNMKSVGLINGEVTDSFGILANQINNVDSAISSATPEITEYSSLKALLSSSDKADAKFADRIDTYKTKMTSLVQALESFSQGKMDNSSYMALVKDFPELAGKSDTLDTAIKQLMDDLDTNLVSDFEEQFGKLESDEDVANLTQYRDSLLKIKDTFSQFESKISDVTSAFSTLKTVISDYHKNGYLTIDNLTNILSLSDEYIAALTNEKGQIDLSTESYQKLVKAELEELKAQELQESLNTVNNINSETGALKYLASSQNITAESALNLADAKWADAYASAAAKDAAQGTGTLYRQTVEQARKSYLVKASLIDSYAKTALTVGDLSKATNDYSTALNDEKDALEDAKDALEDQKDALEDIKSDYTDARDDIKSLIEWTENYIKQIKNDEIDALEEKKEKIDDLIEAQKDLLNAEKDEYEWNKTITEKQDTVASDALAASIASLDDSSAGKKAQKQANEKLADSRADIIDELYEHSIDERLDYLDELKEQQDEYYDDLVDKINDYLADETQIYKDACAMIDNDTGDLYGKLLWYCQKYTTTTKAEFDYMWTSAKNAMQQYNIANLTTFNLIENLEGSMYQVDGAINTISKSISSYETAIEKVQDKIDSLSESAHSAVENINEAISADDSWKKTKNTIDDNTKTTNSSTTSPKSSNNSATKKTTSTTNFALPILFNPSDPRYKSANNRTAKKTTSITSVTPPITIGGKKVALVNPSDPRNKRKTNSLSHYAKGTRHTPSAFISQENGLEAIFTKNPNGAGTYTITTPDSQVFDNKRTDNLYDFASDPEKFLSEKGLSPLSQEELANLGLWGDSSQLGMINSAFGVGGLSGLIEKITGGSGASTNNTSTTNDINPIVNIYIQGNADQSVVDALEKQSDSIVQQTINQIMKIPIRNKFVI